MDNKLFKHVSLCIFIDAVFNFASLESIKICLFSQPQLKREAYEFTSHLLIQLLLYNNIKNVCTIYNTIKIGKLAPQRRHKLFKL